MNSFRSRGLTPELREAEQKIREKAIAFGCDFFETVFELVDSKELSEIAAFGGFPSRYPHWRWGMQYNEIQKNYEHGFSKIYELVINNDPCIAYLMKQNSFMDQKLVMAHVYGHAHFFKNNVWFSKTNKKMLDQMANNAVKVRRIQDKYGREVVEDFIDRCLTIDNLIDIYSLVIKRRRDDEDNIDETRIKEEVVSRKLQVNRDYMEDYINTKDFLEEQEKIVKQEIEAQSRIPLKPERDVLYFLLEHAPLKDWQRTILEIVREEAYYFAPQGMTKICNEGFAVFVHNELMINEFLENSEIVDYADQTSKVLFMGTTINPYKLGFDLLRDIEERWNKGRFGKEYEECQDYEKKKNWDTGLMKGREKIFEVVESYHDVALIDEFLTPEFCEKNKLFVFAENNNTKDYEIKTREFQEIKDQLLSSLTNFGQPVISVQNGNYKNRNELLLLHHHDGKDLDGNTALETLQNIQHIWTRPVHIETLLNGEKVILSFDGKKHSETKIAGELEGS